jgi:hypothetical protein
MPKPLHSVAFEHFMAATADPLEAMMAFGPFMDSESKWARLQPSWPTEAKYRNYHHVYLTPHDIQGYMAEARRVLKQFSDNLIEIERGNFLSQLSTNICSWRQLGIVASDWLVSWKLLWGHLLGRLS